MIGNAVKGRAGRKRGEGEVIGILMILIPMSMSIQVEGTSRRARRHHLCLILMPLALMILGWEEIQSVLRRRSGNAIMKMMNDVWL